MVVDASLYAGEIDLLELRLEYLKEDVDMFLVVEGSLTFTGHHREVKHDWCMNHANVIHQVITDYPEASERNPWKREMWQRNSILRGLKTFPDDTLVLVSDVDELPDMTQMPEYVAPGELYRWQHQVYHYNFHNRVINDNSARIGWSGTSLCRLGDLRIWYPQGVRNRTDAIILNGGYHFSWFYKPEEKIENYSHIELKQIEGTIPEKIQKRWGYQYEYVPGVSHLPQVIQDHPERWGKYIKEKESVTT